MKDLWKSGSLILLIIAVLYIIFLRECKKPLPCPATDEIIVKKSVWDSIISITNMPVKTRIDTIYIKGDVVYVHGIPTSGIIDNNSSDSIYNYTDSLINADINVRYYFVTEGKLLDKEWAYKPLKTQINRIDSIPYPVYVKGDPYEVLVSQRGLYLYGIAGGNSMSFLWGGGLDFITKKSTEIGYQYQRFGSENFHSVKFGFKIFSKK